MEARLGARALSATGSVIAQPIAFGDAHCVFWRGSSFGFT